MNGLYMILGGLLFAVGMLFGSWLYQKGQEHACMACAGCEEDDEEESDWPEEIDVDDHRQADWWKNGEECPY
jgi:hypothetical protein